MPTNRYHGRLPRHTVLAAAVLLAVAVSACDNGTAPDEGEILLFAAPIAGTPMVDVFYGAYMDHASGPGAMDYACGVKAYDGHRGVDILLRNFQVQDTGVAVLAAAPGVVVGVLDGMPDRNTSWAQGGGFGNHVVLSHPGDVRTVYAHLRRSSIAVETGQTVDTGTVLGLVGSSGMSNWPHLHFEVWRHGRAVEPFAGSCSSGPTWWTEQLPYQNEMKVTDAGVSHILPLTWADLLERPPSVTEIPLDADSVRFWIQLANQPAAFVSIEVHGPGGGEPAHVVTGTVGPTFSMRFLTVQIPVRGVLDEPGDWEVRTVQDGLLLWTEPLRVTAPPFPAPAPRAPPAAAPPPPSLMVYDQAPATRAGHHR
jgi:hypothetical protein